MRESEGLVQSVCAFMRFVTQFLAASATAGTMEGSKQGRRLVSAACTISPQGPPEHVQHEPTGCGLEGWVRLQERGSHV